MSKKNFHREHVLLMRWIPLLLDTRATCKVYLTPSSVLFFFHSSIPIFFKIDSFAEGMDYILVKPDNSKKNEGTTELF